MGLSSSFSLRSPDRWPPSLRDLGEDLRLRGVVVALADESLLVERFELLELLLGSLLGGRRGRGRLRRRRLPRPGPPPRKPARRPPRTAPPPSPPPRICWRRRRLLGRRRLLAAALDTATVVPTTAQRRACRRQTPKMAKPCVAQRSSATAPDQDLRPEACRVDSECHALLLSSRPTVVLSLRELGEDLGLRRVVVAFADQPLLVERLELLELLLRRLLGGAAGAGAADCAAAWAAAAEACDAAAAD